MKRRSRAGGERSKDDVERRQSRNAVMHRRPYHVPNRPLASWRGDGGRTAYPRAERGSGAADRDWRCAQDHQPSELRSAGRARTLVKLAARLCEADLVAIHRPRDGAMQFAANFGLSQEWEEIIKRTQLCRGGAPLPGGSCLPARRFKLPMSRPIRNTLSPRVRERADFAPFSQSRSSARARPSE